MKITQAMGMLTMAGALWACGPHYDRHEVTNLQTKGGGSLNESSLDVSVKVGMVVSAELAPYNTDDEYMGVGEITSSNPAVLEVIPLDDVPDGFAFVGRSVGNVELRYFADGEMVVSAKGTVRAQ